MSLTLSCAFATSERSHEHARLAEDLGYTRAWFYDSPALYPDVWVQLCRAAERTRRIGLGPGVLIPSLRHPMATAAALATLASLAGPGRVFAGIGSGFTGRLAMGQRPLRWTWVARYVRTLKALLRGEATEWEGRQIRMLHADGFGAPRPLEVPIVIGAAGPKGVAVARELADGIICAVEPIPGFAWTALLFFGTVLDEGEDPGSPRAIAAAGHAVAVLFHYLYEHRLLDRLPGADAWARVYDAIDPRERHLALHDLHLIGVNARDRPFITGEALAASGRAFTPAALREQLGALQRAGATEIVYQPAGPDIPRELERFARAARG